jgi:hypothetical protein
MAEEKLCPLKVAVAKSVLDDTACKPDCAWYVEGPDGSLKMCAVKLIALSIR